jgi:Clathrin adaptor complex small chain
MTGEAVSGSSSVSCGWHFIVLMSRQGKIRLSEFFSSFSESDKRRILRDIVSDVLPRAPKMCNIIEKGSYKFVYRRYASLYFVVGVPQGMNELIVLEQIHLFVEALDGYFNSGEFIYVCHGMRKLLVQVLTNLPFHVPFSTQCANSILCFHFTNRSLFSLKCSSEACFANRTSEKC